MQNGVDAEATHIWVTIDGSRVVIRDNGHGMDDETIKAVRRFGMSQKSPKRMVGYRGIGIYSAFGICERLTITSRCSGMDHSVGWAFHFGEMRKILEADKAAPSRQGIGLPDLLLQHTELFTDPYEGDLDDHHTVVVLEGVGSEYRAQLNDLSAVNDYLLNTIPVVFPSTGYGEEVNTWLREIVELNPVAITLRVANDPELNVEPYDVVDVYDPVCDWITAEDKKTPLAFYWYVLTTTGRQMSGPASGFLMKIKGFTLGDRLTLRHLWPGVGGRTLYQHFSGEVHILDAAGVYPNASRNDLEPSPTQQILMKRAIDAFAPLSWTARTMQAAVRGNRLTDKLDPTIENLRSRLADADADPYEVYREARNHITELQNVRRDISKHIQAGRGRQKVVLAEAQERFVDRVLNETQAAIGQLDTVSRSVQQTVHRRSGVPGTTCRCPLRSPYWSERKRPSRKWPRI